MLGKDLQMADRLKASVAKAWSPNYDAARIAALSLALEDADTFMHPYARAMVSNAGVLDQALRRAGLQVVGPARNADMPGTYRVVLEVGTAAQATHLSRFAESQSLILGACAVPGKHGAAGLRIGTQLVTRRGAGEEDMLAIADCLASLLAEEGPKPFAAQVAAIAAGLGPVGFCPPVDG